MNYIPFWKQVFDGTQLVKELYGHPIREQLTRRPDMICQTRCHRWLGSRVAMCAVTQLHGSAPGLATVLASSGALTLDGNRPMTTRVVSRTTSGPWRTRSCAV